MLTALSNIRSLFSGSCHEPLAWKMFQKKELFVGCGVCAVGEGALYSLLPVKG